MDRFSFLNAVHSEYVDDLYQQYLLHPDSIEPSWKAFFQGYDFAQDSYNGTSIAHSSTEIPEEVTKEFKVINLINDYRSRGHLFTKTNPVRNRRTYTPDLDISHYGLTPSDLDKTFNAGNILGIGESTTLRQIINHLEQIYCDSIGIEYMYIRDPEMVSWIQNWINNNLNHPTLSKEEKVDILHDLNKAVAFENFLHTKFVGQKRFSIEGGESLIPALGELIERSSQHGVEEVVVGMAHRGRLNVLANIFKKSYSQIFSEFEGKEFEEQMFAGDVKYHLGSSTHTKDRNGKELILHLAPNPSHLEAVDPVVEGIARAKIEDNYHNDASKVLPVLIHGDAAIAGQGVVYEVIQMMKLDGYKTGGTVHIVVNNQIGFTTNYLDARSSTYCTDVGKVTLSPVLHVNADDVEAVVHAIRFAADFRAQFQRDVFIDLLGYRKYGHNEGDEPRFTQPNLYKIISKHPNPREIYYSKLKNEGLFSDSQIEKMQEDFKNLLEVDFDEAKEIKKNVLGQFMPEEWKDFTLPNPKEDLQEVDTSFPIENLKTITEKITTLPSDKKFINKINRLLDQRKSMVFEKNQLDWGMAELLAYGSLLWEKYNVRLSGEDVERGTFSHRHAVILTEEAEEEYILLNAIQEDQGKMSVYNSLLSEYAVMGFDYGFALASPQTLTLWEAQFGDFSNGAQIMIDQYLSAAEDKWKLQNGLVLLLPHGYEGQGAEHSSARIERFLQLCAHNNMIVTNPTTPANFYHLLRQQMKFPFRKPLIVFTPKSLLRHPQCTSSLEDLAEGAFQKIIDDTHADPKKVTKLVFCSGKLYYDLKDRQQSENHNTTAIIRIEQLYPFPYKEWNKILEKYTSYTQLIWAQEEPENMGPWSFILRKLREYPLQLVSQEESSSPATGSSQTFKKKYEELIQKVFEIQKK